MVAINVIARAVPGSWPLYTKNEVQARAPRPQDRTSYFCNHTIRGQTLGSPVALLLQQQRIVNISRATLRREVAIASHRPAEANMWAVFTCYATYIYTAAMYLGKGSCLRSTDAVHTWKKASHCCCICRGMSLGSLEPGPVAAAFTHTERLEHAALFGRIAERPPSTPADSCACIVDCAILRLSLCSFR